jgi:RNA polymerase sigma-B factor
MSDARLLAQLHATRDPRLREEAVERFVPLALSLARRYQRSSSETLDDLRQVACIGLVKAIDRFEPDCGVAFSSFAVPTILGELKRHLRDRAWAVRPPRGLLEDSLKVERLRGTLEHKLGRAPTVAELARAGGLPEERVLEALVASRSYHASSLDQPLSDGDDGTSATLGSTLGTADDGFDAAEQRAVLARLLPALAPREREILRLRFDEDLTQQEISARIGVSQMQVSRLIRQSLQRLRAAAEAPAAAVET